MTIIRVLQGISGIDFSWHPGQLVDLDEDEAAKWTDGHRAELVDELPPPPPATQPAGDPPQVKDPGDGDDAFDPGAHNIKDVRAYLDGVGEQEALRVLEIEDNAQAPRKGITEDRAAILAQARAKDQADAEMAAEASRGGGRGDVVETR
ncbi:hypothetical protein ACIQPR_18205 [Streptomyces sp. NPDC091280]|uniref:hypothetical protein n=1 Tax=Streptomyces sp. NPDC091280 TaxID=3365984 RepID=UPI00380DC49E